MSTDHCCVIYIRVSTDEQARRGYSLADQAELCTARAKALGYGEGDILLLKDEGISGESVHRPGLNRLRDLVARPGRVGHVVIYDPDRFARNLSLQLIVTDEIVRGGAGLEFINFEWKDTPEGKLFYSLRGAIAEYEKAKIKERTRRGREQKARQGLMPVGKDLYGYRFNPETDKLEAVPGEQAVLRLIRDLVLHGPPGGAGPLSCVQAARWLAGSGVPAPKGSTWYASTIARMLKSESYTGAYWVFKTDSTSGKRRSRPRAEQYRVAIEPLWDEETRAALAARIEANRWGRRGRVSPDHFLLRGLVCCGRCGDGQTKMRSHAVVDRRRNHRYYICYRNYGRTAFDTVTGERVRCPSRHFPADAVDDVVWRVVKAQLLQAGPLLERFNAHCRRTGERDRLAADLEALRAAARAKRAECDRYLRLYATGHIPTEAKLDELLESARAALAALEVRAAEAEVALATAALPAGLSLAVLQQTLEQLSLADRRELVARLVRKVIVAEHEIRITGYLTGQAGDAHANPCANRQLE